jgi:hypothetical protein
MPYHVHNLNQLLLPPGSDYPGSLVIGEDGQLIVDYRMELIEPYVQGATYYPQQTVFVAGWTMAANKKTADYPAPQAIGQPFNLYQGAAPETSASAKQVISGQRYTSFEAVQLVSYSVYAFIDQDYDVYLVQDPGGENITTPIGSFTASVTGWSEFNIEPMLIKQNALFDIVSLTTAPPAAPTPVDATYNYLTPQNVSTPVAGDITHARSQADIMRISYTDDIGGDRTALIQALSIGDHIAIGATTWTVQNNDPDTGFANITVTPSITGTAGVQTVTFTVNAPQPTSYMEDVDYWLTSQFVGDAKGIIAIDVPYESATINESAYGIDIKVIQVALSDDWDVVAPGDAATGAARTRLTQDENDWVKASTTFLQYGFAITTDNQWTELARFPIAMNTGVKGTLTVDARRTDTLDLYNAEYATLAVNDAGVLSVQGIEKFELGPMLLGLRAAADGTDLILEVRGAINQDWDWKMAIFFRDII